MDSITDQSLDIKEIIVRNGSTKVQRLKYSVTPFHLLLVHINTGTL